MEKYNIEEVYGIIIKVNNKLVWFYKQRLETSSIPDSYVAYELGVMFDTKSHKPSMIGTAKNIDSGFLGTIVSTTPFPVDENGIFEVKKLTSKSQVCNNYISDKTSEIVKNHLNSKYGTSALLALRKKAEDEIMVKKISFDVPKLDVKIPEGSHTCSVVAVAMALDIDFLTAYYLLAVEGVEQKRLMNTNLVVEEVLKEHGFSYKSVHNTISIGQFILSPLYSYMDSSAGYILTTNDHALYVKGTTVYDGNIGKDGEYKRIHKISDRIDYLNQKVRGVYYVRNKSKNHTNSK